MRAVVGLMFVSKMCIAFVKLCEADLWSICLLKDVGESKSNALREIEIDEAKL